MQKYEQNINNKNLKSCNKIKSKSNGPIFKKMRTAKQSEITNELLNIRLKRIKKEILIKRYYIEILLWK